MFPNPERLEYMDACIIFPSEFVFHPQIVVLWNCEKPLPPRNKWPSTSVPLTVIEGQTKVPANGFWQPFSYCIKLRGVITVFCSAQHPPLFISFTNIKSVWAKTHL